MLGWRARPPAAESRIVVNVNGPVGAAGLQHRPEHPVRPGQRPHRGDQLVAHSGDQKAPEPARAVRDAQCGVTGACELSCRVDQTLQDLVDRQLRGDRQHRVTDGFERWTQGLRHPQDDSFAY